jgi:Uri superfamily endonuclease
MSSKPIAEPNAKAPASDGADRPDPIATADPEALPAVGGAYLLLIDLSSPAPLPPRFGGATLPAGLYGYAGSAYSSGGLRARCRRHLLRRGAIRWHVDWLTRAACGIAAIVLPDDAECALIERLVRRAPVGLPLKGFGSADCRRCDAHLVRFEAPFSIDDALAWLSPDA